MPGVTRFRTTSIQVTTLLLTVLCCRAVAQVRFDLPSQQLAQALTVVASLAHLNILFYPPDVDGIQAPSIKAERNADDALVRLLAGTHLRAVRVNEDTVRIVTDTNIQYAQSAWTAKTRAGYTSTRVHLAYADTSHGIAAVGGATASDQRLADAGTSAGKSQSAAEVLAEVLVTAQKRTERLQDVPVPVTAVSADLLVDSNQLRIEDYYTRVPGLSITPDYVGVPNLTIRGVNNLGGNPTVGIVVDDVPYGASTSLGGNGEAPDFDPSDLEHIEVLRGPQGTLYGASNIGGLLKFVTVDPSTETVTAHIQGGVSSIHNGSGAGYSIRGAANLPLSKTWAVRASAFARHEPGYIDDPAFLGDPTRHRNGVNREDFEGGRLSALWRPSDVLSLKLTALIQHSDADGSSDVDRLAGLGDLQQTHIAGSGWRKRTNQAYSATLTAKLGTIDLTSLSGYNVSRISDSFDYSFALSELTQHGIPGSGFDGFGVTGNPFLTRAKTDKYSQEIRLSSSAGQILDWLFGVFYTNERSRWVQDLLASDPVTDATVGNWYNENFPTTYEEYAAFADLTFHITSKFDIQVGGRESKNKQTFSDIITGIWDPIILGQPSPLVNAEQRTKDNAFTYLVTPRIKISKDLMVYARLASGYRPGGPNYLSEVTGTPPTFKPDKTKNYEVGVKGSTPERMLTFDGSVYYVDWKDIQISAFDVAVNTAYFTNASSAKSQGVELSVEVRPLTGLAVAGWVAWNDAKLTEPFPPTSVAYGISGDRLPFSTRFSGNLSVDDNFPLAANLTGFVGASLSYVGDRQAVFGSLPFPERQDLPAYAQTDAHAGVRFESWTANAFVNNVADRRGVIGGGVNTSPPFGFYYIRPRTVGLLVSKTF